LQYFAVGLGWRADVRDRWPRGTVDGSIFWDFLFVAAVLVRPPPLCARRCVPAGLGYRSFSGAASALHSFAAPGWRGYFHFFFVKHGGGCAHGCLSAPPALGAFAEDSADHPGSGFDRFPSRGL